MIDAPGAACRKTSNYLPRTTRRGGHAQITVPGTERHQTLDAASTRREREAIKIIDSARTGSAGRK